MRRVVVILVSLLGIAACRATSPNATDQPEASTWVPAVHDEIVICGERVHTGAPVVLWFEPPHYDATRSVPRFAPESDDPKAPHGRRYQPGRVRKTPNPEYVAPPPAGERDTRTDAQKVEETTEILVPAGSRDRAGLARVVDQFVLHFDACGLSQTCFRVLQDERGLSVHFMLDVDGTIYQTLDLSDTAWHATKANPRSIGIEIANLGAYAPGKKSALDEWYAADAGGPYLKIPARAGDGGVRTTGFVARPARPERIRGRIQGDDLEQYDFTPEQYDSLVKLAAVLCTELPAIRPDAPRGADGRVLDRALSDANWGVFQGILGHFHVQTNKNDPGPAFDWERFLAAVRARMATLRAGT